MKPVGAKRQRSGKQRWLSTERVIREELAGKTPHEILQIWNDFFEQYTKVREELYRLSVENRKRRGWKFIDNQTTRGMNAQKLHLLGTLNAMIPLIPINMQEKCIQKLQQNPYSKPYLPTSRIKGKT